MPLPHGAWPGAARVRAVPRLVHTRRCGRVQVGGGSSLRSALALSTALIFPTCQQAVAVLLRPYIMALPHSPPSAPCPLLQLAAALWDQQQATAPDQPASAEPQASITKAPHAASEPWDWLVPGLRSLLEGSASLWQQPVARWPFDPVTACGPSAPVGCFLAAPWLDSACAAATPVTPL